MNNGVARKQQARRKELVSFLIMSFIAAAMNLYLQLLVLTVSGWVNRDQLCVIEYLQAENRALREQLGPKRIRWTDAQRRLLAEKARAVGGAALAELGPVVTPCAGTVAV